MVMVKADAYGHGLVPVARFLSEADAFAVARLEEALLLREAGISQRILLLPTLLGIADLKMCSERHIDVTAHEETSVALIAAQARFSPLRVWLELDSGMHRTGLNPEQFVEADRLLSGTPGITEVVHITHFSDANSSFSIQMDKQIACFAQCHALNSEVESSLANSAALISRRQTHADWVRPGIMLYGASPFSDQNVSSLRTVMTLRSHVIAVRTVGVGETVGYNRRWISDRTSRIATVGIGYGDGYSRHAGNGTPVWINGQLAPLAGQVSMDSLTIDVTDCGPVAVGDEAILWGSEISISRVAAHCNTIPYHLFTSLKRRVTREYFPQSS
jgi:alanine racemase